MVRWYRCIPFILMHIACIAVIWVGFSWTALILAVAYYVVRMFFITGFYHRYFSHRAFKTSRAFQFVMAVAGNTAGQRGPLWWAAHHRHHHAHSDEPPDQHSPEHRGFWQSHMGWFMTGAGFVTPIRYIRDLARYPELRFLDRFDWFIPIVSAFIIFGIGAALERFAPALGTNGWQLLIWVFLISTIVLYHFTYTINSLCHTWGSQRFKTDDDSRNNAVLALFTLGEGWHNNHHHYPASARQGFVWYEIDITYYVLRLLAMVGIIWDLRAVPEHVFAEAGATDAS
ncbi:MAG: acyl-CoA desaturase [Planctomycetota bacterium]